MSFLKNLNKDLLKEANSAVMEVVTDLNRDETIKTETHITLQNSK